MDEAKVVAIRDSFTGDEIRDRCFDYNCDCLDEEAMREYFTDEKVEELLSINPHYKDMIKQYNEDIIRQIEAGMI